MRGRFFTLLKEQMRKNPTIYLLVADMGFGLVESIYEEFPERFMNVGISEQNMIGIAAGLCNAGFRPFCYTISNFLVQRCFEQIRNDVCLHDYPVTLVGTSTGFDNGLLGPTHQVIDDIGCIKILPNMNIYSPSTVNAVSMTFDEVMANQTPAYVRIGKGYCESSTQAEGLNHFVKKQDKSELLVITHGTCLENCIKAFNLNDIFSVFCMNKIKPLNKLELKKLFNKYPKIVVIEDHMATSGLYNSLCQCFVEMHLEQSHIYSIGPPEKYEEAVGDKNYFAKKYCYSPEKIAQFILNLRGTL